MSKWRVCFGPSDLRWTVEAESEEEAIHQAMGMFVAHHLKADNFHAIIDTESDRAAMNEFYLQGGNHR